MVAMPGIGKLRKQASKQASKHKAKTKYRIQKLPAKGTQTKNDDTSSLRSYYLPPVVFRKR